MRILKSLRRSLRGWARGRWGRPGRAPRIQLEALEDRTTPSILFTAQNGVLQATNPGGHEVLGNTAEVPIRTIFLGSWWASADGAKAAQQIQNSINPIFHDSPFLDGLHQYGVNHRAGVPLYAPGQPNQLFYYTDPVNNIVQDRDIDYVVWDAIDNRGFPEPDDGPEGEYMVFTSPQLHYFDPTAAGWHNEFMDQDGAETDWAVSGWVSTQFLPGSKSQIDLGYTTSILSEEAGCEGFTDPKWREGKDGWTIHAQGQWAEIGDFEAGDFTYRLNGYLVHSYWSNQDNAYLIPDGNQQTFQVDHDKLILGGGKFSSPWSSDNITIDTNAWGGITVTENGETVSFDPSQPGQNISEIEVDTKATSGAYTNVVTVNNLPWVVSLTIKSGGDDTVHIGKGTMQGILGDVTLTNSSHHTRLWLDDANDSSTHTAVTLDVSGAVGTVQGLGRSLPGMPSEVISFRPNQLSGLTIDGGSGRNAFSVGDTPTSCTTQLNTGTGSNTIIVSGDHARLNIDNSKGGQNLVTVGNKKDGLGDVHATVDVKGARSGDSRTGSTILTVEDRADVTPMTYTLSNTKVTWTSNNDGPFITYQGLSSLRLYGCALGQDSLTVGTSALAFPVTYQGGNQGSNSLTVSNGTNTWTITGPNAGKVGQVTFTGAQNLVGGTSGTDTFQFQPGGSVGMITGGGTGASTWLDYSALNALTDIVMVDLAKGSATGTTSIKGIRNVRGCSAGTNNLTGNAAGNILVGGGGHNLITGGSGVSLLISGSGGGKVVGGSGGDLLIGGSTAYDANSAALMAIAGEWGLSPGNHSYAWYLARIGYLKNGGGSVSGSTTLSPLAVHLTAPVTLVGGASKPGLWDWFFVNPHDLAGAKPKVVIVNPEKGEKVD